MGILKDFKRLSVFVGGIILLVGLGVTITLSQQTQDIQQHASAAFVPPDGMGIIDSCGATCLDHVDLFSKAGFKIVLDYSIWGKTTTVAQIQAYAARAQQDNIKIIWSLKDMWTDKFTTFGSYSGLTAHCGCSNKIGLAKYLVGQVKNFPATWGYYIADEPSGTTAYNAVSALSAAIHQVDTVHLLLLVKSDALFNGNPDIIASGLPSYTALADVMGEDWYPVSYRQNLNQTGALASKTQYVASNHGRQAAMVLEVNSGNSKDYIHATAYPSQSQMAQMLLATLQNSHPRMILWYWYPGTSSTQWNNLLTAIHTIFPLPTTKPSPTAASSSTPTFIHTPTLSSPPTIPTKILIPTLILQRIPSDFDGDGKITLTDYRLFLECYGSKFGTTTCTVGKAADLDGDGKVNIADYYIFVGQYYQYNRP